MMRVARAFGFALILCVVLNAAKSHAAGGTPTEEQLKAVFVFNFTHFTEWPASSFRSPDQPLVICVLGSEVFATELGDVVRGEQVAGHPLETRRFRDPGEGDDCHILYIDRTEERELPGALARLQGRGTLTVSDVDGASRLGTMIELARNENRIQLLINVDAVRMAGLTLSSKLLRPARIVQVGRN